MRFIAVCHLIAILLMLFSVTMVPPFLVDLYYEESLSGVYVLAFVVSFVSGAVLWFFTRHSDRELKIRDGFLVVVLFWLILSLYGMIPFVAGDHPPLSLLDGLFESVSGWTTTGATMLSGIEFLPHSLQYYRQQLQFLGGMGIIVLAVAVLPMLGIGGMQLYQAEMPGPIKDQKLTPRIAQTAKVLWIIYCGLTLVCLLCYRWGGMSWFNAVGEAFSTVATGGFSMHDSSFGFYENPMIHGVAILFMLMSSLNYGLHYMAFRKGGWHAYYQDLECRRFLMKVFCVFAVVSLGLWIAEHYQHGLETLQYGLFQTVSIMTTTGLTTDNYHEWPRVLSLLLMFFGLIGGCAASTCGGMKTMRLLILRRQGVIALQKMIHPHAVFSLRLGDKEISNEVIRSVSAFIYVFVTLFITLQLVLMAFDLNYKTAFGCLVATLANVGVGVGDILPNFAHLNNPCKIVLIFAMLAGRLEIFTLLVLFLPGYWRK